MQAIVRRLMARYAKPKQAVLDGLNKEIKHDVCRAIRAHLETAIFCASCGDCIRCYGEDPCTNTRDGIHVVPTDEEML
jgi:hypothetical protein